MRKNAVYILLIAILLALIIDILIRIYYCQGVYLKFDSGEFNNIASPIISLLGFIGVIVTIVIAMKQFKLSISEKYLIQLNDYIKSNYEEVEKSEVDKLPYKKGDIVKFFSYVRLEYESLLQDKNYTTNKELIKQDNYDLNPQTYDNILGSLRLFNVQSRMLFKEYFNKLNEILENPQIVENHKEIIIGNFINNVLSYYIASCEIIKNTYPEMIDDFFIGIDLSIKEKPQIMYYFDDDFFELYDFIMKNENLKKHYK